MQELLDQLITPEVRMVLYLMVICVVMLYILSIVYVIRDAQRRGAEPWWMWAIISVIPIVGLLAYVILRPSSYLIDREEQDLDIALREHQLSHYGICPKCGAPIDRDFVVCPICNTQVRNVCPTCPRPLNALFSPGLLLPPRPANWGRVQLCAKLNTSLICGGGQAVICYAFVARWLSDARLW